MIAALILNFRYLGAAPVTEKASPMNQLVEKTAALASLQSAVTDVRIELN